MSHSIRLRIASAIALVCAHGTGTASAVGLDWVAVGDAGNPCEVQAEGCFGSVAAPFLISRTEVTNAQYAEFLNAVAAADPNALYHPSMANAGSGFGGINRSGSAGSYVYAAAPGREEMPVNFVAFYDALRFANWLHNGQPTGAQGAATTEDGAYTITPQGIADNAITRNPGATVAVASEDEWYKAAYYDAITASHFDYPAAAPAPTGCSDASGSGNSANCENHVAEGSGGLAAVGRFTGSASPYGTLDQGGNLWEWNESIQLADFRGLRGGAFNHAASQLAAAARSLNHPQAEANNIGFRVTRLPEPAGLLAQACALLSVLALRRRPRAA